MWKDAVLKQEVESHSPTIPCPSDLLSFPQAMKNEELRYCDFLFGTIYA